MMEDNRDIIDSITEFNNANRDAYLKTKESEWVESNVNNIIDTIYGGELKPIKQGKMEEILNNVQEQSVNKAVIENVDNTILANIVAEKVNYEFANMVLVKPMDVEMVFKTLTVPEDSGEKDEEGQPVMQMTIKQIETESLLRKGVVLATPASFKATEGKEGMLVLNVGDIVVYPNKRSIDFDLFKDSALVPYYEILAKVA